MVTSDFETGLPCTELNMDNEYSLHIFFVKIYLKKTKHKLERNDFCQLFLFYFLKQPDFPAIFALRQKTEACYETEQ